MYGGHFAMGLMLTTVFPKARRVPVLASVGALDVLDGLLVWAGVNRVTPDAREFLGFQLTVIDWDHSLVMALLWSALAGLLFWKDAVTRGPVAMGVFSHWVLDLPLHNNDLALYPGSSVHFGWGLWGSLGSGAWLLELVLVILAGIFVGLRTPPTRRFHGRGAWLAAAVVVILQLSYAPWVSPMRLAASLG